MAALRLIVHGDDFGLSEGVNDGIVRAHRDGILTSASIIAPGEAFEHAVRLARDTPGLDIGVHLTLVGEKPLSPVEKIPTLVGANGFLHPGAGVFVSRYLRGSLSISEIRSELDAQIARVRASGITVTHLDGHQHLHVLPGIRRIVGELAAHHGIRCIRHPMETPRLYMLREPGSLGRFLQLLVLNAFCAAARTGDAKHAAHFCGFFYGGRLAKENLARVLRHLPDAGTCELMCHPGDGEPDSRYAAWGYDWSRECQALTDRTIGDYLRARKIELISYANL
ncbi:MAG TPA: ChbG/HpnK family deacetylase [Casimicrobiaceae bacterium]|nr:ChbG/HpnK family deacetylase [Casimicrobiaceae bacterium]